VPNPNAADGRAGTGTNLVQFESYELVTYVPNPGKADGEIGTGTNLRFIPDTTPVPNPNAADGRLGTGSNLATVRSYLPITYVPNPFAADGQGGEPTPPPQPWPNGADGPLIINGTTVNLTPSTKDYSVINITNGGKLKITSTDGAWMILGCAGDITVDATSSIEYRGIDWYPLINQNIVATAPDDMALSYFVFVSIGSGNGGQTFEGLAAGEPVIGRAGGDNANTGNGAGGAATAGVGHDATLTAAGDGAEADTGGTPSPAPGGDGGTALGQSGTAGTTVTASTPNYTDGSGGGGGFRGGMGGAIYIKCGGTITVLGTITVAGQAGGNGGDGGGAIDNPASFGGGGGGAGTGGNGGQLVIRAKGGDAGQLTANTNLLGGPSGTPGNGGIAYNGSLVASDPDPGNPDPPRAYMNGEAGEFGFDGSDGTLDFQLY